MTAPFIPPWLEPQPIPQLYAQGMNTGIAAAAQRNEAMQAAARLAQQNAALQQQAIAQAAELDLNRYIADQRVAQAAIDSQIEQQRISAMAALKEQEFMQRATTEAEKLANAERMIELREKQAQEMANNREALLALREKYTDWRTGQPASRNSYDQMDMAKYRALLDKKTTLEGDRFAMDNAPPGTYEAITNELQQLEAQMRQVRPSNVAVPVGGGPYDYIWDNRAGSLVRPPQVQ